MENVRTIFEPINAHKKCIRKSRLSIADPHFGRPKRFSKQFLEVSIAGSKNISKKSTKKEFFNFES